MARLNISRLAAVAGGLVVAGMVVWGCSPKSSGAEGEGGSTSSAGNEFSGLAGEVKIDGSSTVYPIQSALATLFNERADGVKVSVVSSGTGAGMSKFAAGEIDIADASRPIKSGEMEALATAGIEFVELPVAYDGLSIVVSNENDWLKQITIEQLHMIWDKDSKVKTWNQIDPSFPKEKIMLFGPTSAHGTYEYFNEAVNGDAKNTRSDYEQCAEYTMLITGVEGSKYSLGYVGYSYYFLSKDKLRVVPVVNKTGEAVTPSAETISNGTYNPLSRPLMVYVKKSSLDRPEVAAYVKFLVGDGNKEAVDVTGYITLPENIMSLVRKRLEDRTVGSVLSTLEPGAGLAEVLAAQK